MRAYTLFVVQIGILSFAISSNLFSQSLEESYCPIHGQEFEENMAKIMSDCDPLTSVCYGNFKPAQDTLRILVVYIRFEDDSSTTLSYWNAYPDTSNIFNTPSWMSDSIDSLATMTSNNYFNISNYFKVMSDNNYHLIGDAVYIQVPSKSTFTDNLGIKLEGLELMEATNRFVFDYLDEKLDLSIYDNYDRVRSKDHLKSSDNILDMAFMLYRTPGSQHFAGVEYNRFGGIAALGNGGIQTLGSGLIINYDMLKTNSSGLTVHMQGDQKINFDGIIHEFGHYIMGGNHPYTDGFSNVRSKGRSGYWGIFNGHSGTNSMNAYEKELLGWIYVPELTNDTTFTLGDFLTTKESFKYKVGTSGPDDEWFYFENRQLTHSTTGIYNSYDEPSYNTSDKGLFILHVQEPYLSQFSNSLEAVVSDGNWDWTNTGFVSACNPSGEPAFEKNIANRYGESFKDPLLTVYNPSDNPPFNYKTTLFVKSSDPTQCKRYYLGFDSSDISSFNDKSRALITPYTNPPFIKRDKTPVNIGIRINDKLGKSLEIEFYNSSYDHYTIQDDVIWDRQIILDNDVTVSDNKIISVLDGTSISTTTSQSISLSNSSKFLIDNKGEKTTVTIEDGVTLNINSGSNLELESGTSGLASNKTTLIVKGVLNINSGSTVDLGDHALIIAEDGGEVNVSSGATINSTVIGEFNAGNNGLVMFNGNHIFNSSVCLMTLPGGTMEFNGSLTLDNGAFIQAHSTGGGIYKFDDNVTLKGSGNPDGYVMDLNDGTRIEMGYNNKILTYSGAKIRSIGTVASPVKFTYFEPFDVDNAWNSIELRGDANIFEYTIVEGTVSSGIYFRSDDNMVEYSSIRNNFGYGIRTDSDYSGGWGSVQILDSKIENNGSHGVYARNSHVSLEYNDIKNNDGDGIYVYNAHIGHNTNGMGYFRGNDIADNGSNAVQIAYNGDVYDGYSTTKGYNQFDDNGSHSIYLSSSNARWWDASGGSYTAVSEPTTSIKYVYNLAQTTSGESTVSWTVGVENNAWDYAVPSSSRFHGSVDYTPYQTTQMFADAGPRGTVAAKMIATNSSSFGNQVISSSTVSNATEGLNTDEERDYYLEVRNELIRLKTELEEKPSDARVPQKLNGLMGYYNELPEDKKSEFSSVKTVLVGFKSDAHLLGISQGILSGERLASETALMLEAQQLVVEGRPESALEIIEEHKGKFSNLDIQREISFIAAASLEYLGRYEEAIKLYSELSVFSKRGIDPKNTETDYVDEIAYLEQLIHERDGTKSGDVQEEIRVKPVVDAKPTEFKLNSAYPNPFNPSTVFSFEMPETGNVKVEVYDISGRLVSVLTNQSYQAGVHSLTFDAGELASGLYLIRADLAGRVQSQKITLIK